MFRIFAIFSKWVPHYHLGESIIRSYYSKPPTPKSQDFNEMVNFKNKFPIFLLALRNYHL
jgi:hypothetical protein